MNRCIRAFVLLACGLVVACKPEKNAPAPGAPPALSAAAAAMAETPDDPRVKCPPGAKQVHIDVSGSTGIVCQDSDGLSHGPSINFYLDGKMGLEEHFVHGQYEGVKRSWNPDGKPSLESHYRDGELEGVSHTWHDNGHLATETLWHKGKKIGRTKYWDERGRRLSDED